ncbi:MAG: hypothetical protein A4S14_01385 [Proteobacteria bacterium SG_bin9]|nr:MAG: hypothetical protein A4S14_01385 [Proteobacteria bacterium SG_bin9]
MARTKPPQAVNLRADAQQSEWKDPDWDHHDEAASARARKLLSKRRAPSIPTIHGIGDRLMSAASWLRGERWLQRVLVAGLFVLGVFAICFGGLWWRLGAGPINLDMATPWLASAIEANIGRDHTVEVGGTQIERAGRARIAVRLRDIVVRDRDRVVVANAPKAEVKLSGAALLIGQVRAHSLSLVDAELAVRITPDGRITVSTGDSARPIATGQAKTLPGNATPPAASQPALPLPGQNPLASSPRRGERTGTSGLLAALDWLDSLSATGLDGQNLDELGIKNGVLVVDDQQRGSRTTFENISVALRRANNGGVELRVGEEGSAPWSVGAVIGPPANGVRSIEIYARQVSTKTLLLALRATGSNFSADLPLTGELKGELGRDGLPTFFRGRLTADAGQITDSDTPDYPMKIDKIEMNVDWDSSRRVLVAPFQVVSGANRVTLLAYLEPPNDRVPSWQLGFSGGTILLAGAKGETPLIVNRIAVSLRFDTENRRIVLTQADFSNGEIGVAGNGALDYSTAEPRLTLGFAGTPMSATALKQMWPILIVPEVREWVIERVERGTIQRIDIAVNAPVKNLSRSGPPLPEDGLSLNIVGNGVTMRPVDDIPQLRDGDLKARVTGRTAVVTIGQAVVDTPAGRKLNISDLVFDVPDMVPKPIPAKVKFRIEGPVPAAAEILASDRLSEFTGSTIDPNSSTGKVSAIVNMGMPLKNALTKADTTYSINVDLGGFSADKMVMNQKIEGNALKVIANNQGYQVRGDVRIAGQPATIDYRKPSGDGDADVRVSTTLDDATRARFGIDLGPAISGNIPLKLTGKIGGGDRDNKLGVEADLTSVKIDNLLPGWVKVAGRTSKVTFNVVQKPQSTRLEDIVIDGSGVLIKGSMELDQNNDPVSVNFPVFAPSEGDKAVLRAERAPDGVMKVTMRGDVFDGRNFIKSTISGKDTDTRNKTKSVDIDLDLKVGAIAGFFGEAARSVDVKLSRRGGTIRTFNLNGKIGRDAALTGDIRARGPGQVLYLETNDAGALFRFTDTYSKVVGGKMWLAMDPPSSQPSPQEGLINVRDFVVRGEQALDRVVNNAGGPNGQSSGVSFSGMRAEFTRQPTQLTIKDGVLRGPTVGATIEGGIDFQANQVRMNGTFVPLYGLNNIFGQLPVVGLFLGGGSDEGLIGITYEVVGTPGAPVIRVNPISAMAPGLTRKIFGFNTGRPQSPNDFQPSYQQPN